jgi:hypothetical protein
VSAGSSFETRSEETGAALVEEMRRENELSRSRRCAIAGSSHIISMFETQPARR